MVLVNDITERKRAEERLHEQTEIINRAQDAMVSQSAQGRKLAAAAPNSPATGYSSSTANVDDSNIICVQPPPAWGMVEMECRR